MRDFARIEEIYHQALQIPIENRNDFLRNSCGDDEELLNEVESLLTFDEKAKDFIEIPPIDVAANLINEQNKEKLIGQIFSHYQILEKLGAGGMGEVYLAEDTRLNRKVALKLLPLQFSQDAERRKRFEKEARAVSSLNHPNIITIYGIEKNESFNFIATELVEGKTLRELIAEKPFSPKETIELAIQIADALDSAHSLGIIHRDIKPANIMIRQDGIVKVLDFGLAKLSKHGGDSANFETREHTAPNGVMGTINYMSPEQALGETVDFRTDIFSFGVVLYEMLTGKRPFDGVSDAAIYNATINHTPPSLSELKPEIPLALDKIIFHTIEKKREKRYQTISELKRDLQELKENPNSDLFAKKFVAKQKSSFAKFAIPAFAILLISLVSYFLFFNRLPNQALEGKNFTYTQLTSQNGEELFPNLSPDGKSFLYSSRESGNWDVYLQKIGESKAVNLTQNSTFDDMQGVFSPDGKQIAFRSERDGGGIFLMNLGGESVKRLSDFGFTPSWSADGTELVVSTDNVIENVRGYFGELWAINVAEGTKRLITKIDADSPNWSPTGQRIAFSGMSENSNIDIKTVSAEGGEPVPVMDDDYVDKNPFWSVDGKFLYFFSNRGGNMNLWRVPIDENTGKALGTPQPQTMPANDTNFAGISRDGKSFIYNQNVKYSNFFKSDFDSKNEIIEKNAVEITKGSKITTNPNVSDDNKILTFDSFGDKQEDLFVADSDGRNIRQLTDDIEKDRAPHLSPDGKRIAFITDTTGKFEGWMVNTDGSEKRLVAKSPENNFAQLPLWSSDGTHLLFNMSESFPVIYDPDKNADEQTPQEIKPDSNAPPTFLAWSWSSDQQKLAGTFWNEAQNSTNIAILDLTNGKFEKLTDFGTRPFWLADNRRLIFLNRDRLYLLDSKTNRMKEIFSAVPYLLQSFTLSKDNRTIYYAIQKSESDIWLANTQ